MSASTSPRSTEIRKPASTTTDHSVSAVVTTGSSSSVQLRCSRLRRTSCAHSNAPGRPQPIESPGGCTRSPSKLERNLVKELFVLIVKADCCRTHDASRELLDAVSDQDWGVGRIRRPGNGQQVTHSSTTGFSSPCAQAAARYDPENRCTSPATGTCECAEPSWVPPARPACSRRRSPPCPRRHAPEPSDTHPSPARAAGTARGGRTGTPAHPGPADRAPAPAPPAQRTRYRSTRRRSPPPSRRLPVGTITPAPRGSARRTPPRRNRPIDPNRRRRPQRTPATSSGLVPRMIKGTRERGPATITRCHERRARRTQQVFPGSCGPCCLGRFGV